jgi:hypothetical protein
MGANLPDKVVRTLSESTYDEKFIFHLRASNSFTYKGTL